MIKPFKNLIILVIKSVISAFVDMVILDDLGLNVQQALELNFASILLKYLGFYSHV